MSLNVPLLRSSFALVLERKPDLSDRFYEVGGEDWTPELAGAWTDAFGAIASLMQRPAAS